MRTKKRLLPAVVASVLLAAAAPAAMAQQASNTGVFSNVVVFGDSLSDAGYFRPILAAQGLPPALVSILGRFTTSPGPVWSEVISQYYGTAPAPSNADGSIFAQGGARVTGPGYSTPTGAAERSIQVQIDEYLARNGGHADPNALYGLWAGANDVFAQLTALQAGQITQAELQTNVLAAAGAEIQQIARLQAAGARYIVVMSLPDIGGTPRFVGTPFQSPVTQLSAGYNTTLFSGLQQAGVRVIPVDIFSLFAEISANPGRYGFTNNTTPACKPFPPFSSAPDAFWCPPQAWVSADANLTHVYADTVHPTTGAQALVAQFVEAMVDAPMQYSMLAESALGARESMVRTVNDGLLAQRRGPVGGLHVFANVNGGSFDVDAGAGTPGFDSNVRAAAVGIASRISDTVTLGVAVGEGRLDASFGNGLGGFRTRDRAVSLFGALDWGGFYGTGVVTIGNLRFDDVERNIRLGTAVRRATARPSGSNASSFFTAGYDFLIGSRARVGPVVTLTTANVDVNGFDEEGAESSSLRIGSQKRRSEVWGIGIAASAELGGGWTPWARVTAEHERRDDARFVSATPLTLATGNAYELPAYSADRDFVAVAAGLAGYITPKVGLGVNLYSIQSRAGGNDEGAGLTLSVKF
jgi:outer membrane lipase/esterase